MIRWLLVPRFFFHLYDDMIVADLEGAEMLDAEAACARAVASAREIACAEVMQGRLDLNHRIEVEDETGELLATVYFRDVIQLQS